MTRIALVTGGTRGIGRAISEGLAAKGYKVAANYGGNTEAAKAFETETGIATFKFDVSRTRLARLILSSTMPGSLGTVHSIK